jgi:hypothetical protein
MTEFAAGWDGDLALEVGPIWMARQYMDGSLLDVDELVRILDGVLRCGPSACIPTVEVIPQRAG